MSASTKSAPRAEIPFLVEILDSHIAYFRLESALDTLAQFDAALASFSDKEIDAVILDLGTPRWRRLRDGGRICAPVLSEGEAALLDSEAKRNRKGFLLQTRILPFKALSCF